MTTHVILLITVSLISFCSPALPPQIRVCSRNDPQIAACFKNSMELLRNQLKTGQIAPGFVVEPIDPFNIGDLAVNRGFDVKLMGMRAYGLSNFKIEKMRVNVEKLKVEMLMSVPRVQATAKYTLKWQLGVLNLQGAGDASADIRDVKIVMKLNGNRFQRGGQSYIKFDSVKVEIRHNGLSVHFDNLFMGQKALEDVGNQVINQNVGLLEQDILPLIEKTLERKVLSSMNDVFSKANEFEFFPN